MKIVCKSVALAIASLLVGSAVAQTPPGSAASLSLESVFNKYLAAVNAGDAKAVRDLLDPDLKMGRRPPVSVCGPEKKDVDCQFDALKFALLDQKAKVTATGIRQEGDILYANTSAVSDKIKSTGAERVLFSEEYDVKNGRIMSIVHKPNMEDLQTKTYVQNGSGGGPPPSGAKPLNPPGGR